MLRIDKSSYRWALDHALSFGDSNIFPMCFEYQAIDYDWDNIGTWLEQQDILNWMTRPHRRCLAPKNRFGFRLSTQLDPLDYILYTALVYEIGNDIEEKRVPKEANIIHSNRFTHSDNGSFFDENYNYGTFIQKSKELIETGNYNYVVVADIADFFPRIYSHRLENALSSATNKVNHVRAIKNLMAQWNEHNSYGIPVGPSASKLLSEIALDDIDRLLLSENAIFCRYSDDFRIFCPDFRYAYEMLALLANVLFENHGLTLQQSKTEILTIRAFNEKFISTEKQIELNSLSSRFYKILEDNGLDNPYDQIDFDDLSEESQDELTALNLEDILKEQVEKDIIDLQITKFVLRRLGQVNCDVSNLLIENIEKLYPVFKDVIEYCNALRCIDHNKGNIIGKIMIQLLEQSVIGHLEYHRMWLFNLFSKDTKWDNKDQFVRLFGEYEDSFSKREIVLALGFENQDHWFRTKKRSLFEYSPWIRRALLFGGKCLPQDERRHWYSSLSQRLDPLEKSIVAWVRSNTI